MSVLIENGINIDELIKKPRKPRMKKIVEQAVRQNSIIEELDIIKEESKVDESKVEVKVDVKVEDVVEVKVEEEGLTEPIIYRCELCDKSFKSLVIFTKHATTAYHLRKELITNRKKI